MDHPLTTSADNERASLSGDSQIASEFVLFMQRFLDGALHYFGGVPVPTQYDIETSSIHIDFEGSINNDGHNSVKIKPFTGRVYQAVFEPGDTVEVDFNTDDTAAVLSYKITGTTDWKTLMPGQSVQFFSHCCDIPPTYDFLIVSIADKDTSEGEIVIKPI
ncbi:hypothetical protein NA56DRAFT_319384 [Hyaloscypha hepaticicola]|uniref:Uncharacterized protein n=1 Tax=Hyaloscypha hepaticicola TaxID=2082293 RepID=A0A2J6PQI0_9HELO|nr:hypothetical protein NA56DRAFT_319384 [Hyaloscypha hepaticicola]